MVKDIPILKRQISISGIPVVQTGNYQEKAWRQAAETFKDFADESFRKQEKLNDQILRNQELKFLNKSHTAINDLYFANQSNPENLRTSYAAIKKGFLKEVTNPQLREELSFKFDTQAQSFLNRATENFQNVVDDESRQSSLINLEVLKRDGEVIGGTLFSDDNLIAIEAGRTFQAILQEAGNTLDMKGLDGKPIFSADQRFSYAQEMIDNTLVAGIKNNYNNAIDQEQYVSRFINGDLKFKLANELGEINDIDAREVLGSELTERLTSYFERDLSQKQNLKNKEIKRLQNIALIDSALEGETFITSQSKEHKDAIEDHFKVFKEKVQSLPQEQQIQQYIDYVSNTGIYPQELKNQINGLLDMGDENQKVFAAQMINQISIANPQTINQISNQQRALARKISDAVNSGVSPINAVEFANSNIFEKDSAGYAERTIRFKKDKKEFDISLHPKSSFSFFGQDLGDEEVFRPEMIDEFNTLNKDFYMKYGMNAEQAQQEAMKTIAKTWNKTSIGGVERWQKFAPTAVYGEQYGEEWVEKQLISYLTEVQKTIKADLKTKEPTYLDRLFSPIDTSFQYVDFLEGKIDLNKVRLEANPLTTKGNKVGYDIYVVTDQGIDILRDKNNMPVKPFFPDITKSDEFTQKIAKQKTSKEKIYKKRKYLETQETLKQNLNIQSIKEGF